MNTLSNKHQRGAVLASALIILVSLTMIAVSVDYRNTLGEMMAANQRDSVNAMMIAENGIEVAYTIVKSNYDQLPASICNFNGEGGYLAQGSVSGGSYAVTVSGSNCVPGSSAILSSVGTVNGAVRQVEIVLEMKSGGGSKYAILTDTDIDSISGNPVITGAYADVHTNSDLNISGNPDISGTISASGDINNDGDGTFGGEVQGASTVEIPHIYPPTFSGFATVIFTPNCIVIQILGGGGSAVLADASDNKWHGWDCSSGDKWTMGDSDPSGGLYDAFYYIQGNMVISGSPDVLWKASFVAEGYIEISGNAIFEPWGQTGDATADNILFYAGNDLKINGNPDQDFFGILATHMDIQISGNPNLTGTIIAENELHGSGQQVQSGQEVKSLVDKNEFNGNMILVSTGQGLGGSSQELAVTAWREIIH